MSDNSSYQISVVIVNYNVEYFLDQCLHSLYKSLQGISSEVFVVDNASVDGSIHMIETKYPEVKIIANDDNKGFSTANNQAIEQAKGKYVLLLNPDTVVAEDTISKTLAFMDMHKDAGGLGVKMVDGKGTFLPESKRGLPTPAVAFYKIFGLSKLFPRSKRFGQYHAGHISSEQTAEIDVLSGAFMLLRKETLDKVGLLDEKFFMYGEDIDLSYRIQLGGLKNYYFADTSIIHYKGESTKKSSVNYVFVFYKAMVIFAKKHFSGNFAALFSLFIYTGIYLRALAAIITRVIKRSFLPLIDLSYIVGGCFLLTNYWSQSSIEFPLDLIKYSIPVYGFTWLLSVFINGGYDKPIRIFKYLKGVTLGTIAILVVYAVLPKSLQFSRLFIFIGAAWVFAYYLISRIFLHFAIPSRFSLRNNERQNFAIVGSRNEQDRIERIIRQSHNNVRKVDHIKPEEIENDLLDWKERTEWIFCAKDVAYRDIIEFMVRYRQKPFEYKIAPFKSDYLIGSNSIDTAGDLYIININTLGNPENVRKKRIFDLSFAIGMLLTFPIIIFFFDQKAKYLKNLINILIGKHTFIGFSEEALNRDVRLPRTKPGILSPSDILSDLDVTTRDKLNLLYARDYSLRKDLSIVLRSWRKLDS